MTTKAQAIRLAILIEALSLPVFFVRTYFSVSSFLFSWFFTLNFPAILLFRWHVWEQHGSDVVFPLVVLPIILIQGVIWFFVWFGLLSAFKKIRSKWRHKVDA
jgi:hypothetical protein